MEVLESLYKIALKTLEPVCSKGQFSSNSEVTTVYELVGILRRICAIWSYEEPQGEQQELFSNRGSYDGNSMRSYNSYGGNGGSYESSYEGSYDMGGNRRGVQSHMSRAMGNSGHNEEEFMSIMRKMRDYVPDDTKQEIDRLLSQRGR